MSLTLLSQQGRRLAARWRMARPPEGTTPAPAEVTIGTTVVAPNPERFGANIEVFDYEPWTLNAAILNNWIADGGMEPIILRYKGTATGGDTTTIANDAGPTTSAGEMVGDGFFDGADVRVYRVTDGHVHLLRTDRVARYLTSEASGYRIILDAVGPPVQAGDVYILSQIRDDVPTDRLHPCAETLADADCWHIYPNWGDRSAVTMRRDRATAAPDRGSRTSMRIDARAAMEAGLLQFVAAPPHRHAHNAFDPAGTYRFEIWLKQQGVADGKVSVWLGPYRERIQQTFTVSGEWAGYRFTFKGPRHMLRDDFSQLNITFHGPGTLWVDDVRLFDTRRPPYAVRPEVLEAVKAYRPGTLRIWSGQTNTAWGTTLDNWIAPDGRGLRLWDPRHGRVTAALFSLPTALAFARSTGAMPWLIVHPSFDEAEWRGLIEYLAGPPTSPYGARRAASGQVRPWTDEFARIRIEYGNEPWNAIFEPWIFANGLQYGQFAEYFFGQAKESPSYAAAADKLDFAVGGWVLSTGPRTFGTRARQASPSASIVGLSSYLAGWDRSQIPAHTREEQFQHTLLYAPWILHTLTDRQVATHSLLAKMGFPATLATPESGPEYSLPSPGKAFNPIQERFGKSLAAGVSTLDALLYNASKGFGPQAYHAFGVGAGWSSHTAWTKGYRPHPAWQALELRNRYAEGDMVAVDIAGGPRADLPELRNERYRVPARPAVPLIAAYAFRRGGRYAIFVLSRQLSSPTPVRLHLPAPPSAATLYTLAGDPRATNLEALRVKVRRRRVRRFTQHYIFAMPPGSIYLFVVDTE